MKTQWDGLYFKASNCTGRLVGVRDRLCDRPIADW